MNPFPKRVFAVLLSLVLMHDSTAWANPFITRGSQSSSHNLVTSQAMMLPMGSDTHGKTLIRMVQLAGVVLAGSMGFMVGNVSMDVPEGENASIAKLRALSEEERLRQPIGALPLSIRAHNAVLNAACETIGDLVTQHPKALLLQHNFGKTSLREIVSVLSQIGLHLEETPPSMKVLESLSPEKRHNRSILYLDLPKRQIELLRNIGILTIGSLADMTTTEIVDLLGSFDADDVIEKLERLGFSLDTQDVHLEWRHSLVRDKIKNMETWVASADHPIPSTVDWADALDDVAAVLAGKKLAAIVDIDEDSIETVQVVVWNIMKRKALRYGCIVGQMPWRERLGGPLTYRHVIGRPENVNALIHLYQEIADFRHLYDDTMHRNIGQNLGIPEAAITQYLENPERRISDIRELLIQLGYSFRMAYENNRFVNSETWQTDSGDYVILDFGTGQILAGDNFALDEPDTMESNYRVTTMNDLVQRNLPLNSPVVEGDLSLPNPSTPRPPSPRGPRDGSPQMRANETWGDAPGDGRPARRIESQRQMWRGTGAGMPIYGPLSQKAKLREVLDELKTSGRLGSRILDLGSARSTAQYLGLVDEERVVAIDWVHDSAGVLDLRNSLHMPILLVEGDVQDLDSVLAKRGIKSFLKVRRGEPIFDTIVMSDILNYVDFRVVIDKALKYLTPGGQIVIVNMAGVGLDEELFSDRGVKSNKSLRDYLERQGLKVNAIESARQDTTNRLDDSSREILVCQRFRPNTTSRPLSPLGPSSTTKLAPKGEFDSPAPGHQRPAGKASAVQPDPTQLKADIEKDLEVVQANLRVANATLASVNREQNQGTEDWKRRRQLATETVHRWAEREKALTAQGRNRHHSFDGRSVPNPLMGGPRTLRSPKSEFDSEGSGDAKPAKRDTPDTAIPENDTPSRNLGAVAAEPVETREFRQTVYEQFIGANGNAPELLRLARKSHETLFPEIKLQLCEVLFLSAGGFPVSEVASNAPHKNAAKPIAIPTAKNRRNALHEIFADNRIPYSSEQYAVHVLQRLGAPMISIEWIDQWLPRDSVGAVTNLPRIKRYLDDLDLTDTEKITLLLALQGFPNGEIAKILKISENVVKNHHMNAVFRKLRKIGVQKRSDLFFIVGPELALAQQADEAEAAAKASGESPTPRPLSPRDGAPRSTPKDGIFDDGSGYQRREYSKSVVGRTDSLQIIKLRNNVYVLNPLLLRSNMSRYMRAMLAELKDFIKDGILQAANSEILNSLRQRHSPAHFVLADGQHNRNPIKNKEIARKVMDYYELLVGMPVLSNPMDRIFWIAMVISQGSIGLSRDVLIASLPKSRSHLWHEKRHRAFFTLDESAQRSLLKWGTALLRNKDYDDMFAEFLRVNGEDSHEIVVHLTELPIATLEFVFEKELNELDTEERELLVGALVQLRKMSRPTRAEIKDLRETREILLRSLASAA